MENSLKILSDITIFNKYAKYNEELQRRETWEEIILRWKTMMIEKFPEYTEKLEEISRDFILPKIVLPSMRALQFAGKAIEKNPARSFNCSYLLANHVASFRESCFLLLSGCGVGYSVQYQHVEELPSVRRPKTYSRYLVGDSIAGWSDAIDALFQAYLCGGVKPIFDFSDIRPKGTKLKTSGGRAPGPRPLAKSLRQCETILKKAIGRQLRPIEVHDCLCFIAVAVVSGGIRRSAMISIFSQEDHEMAICKSGNWWEENGQRGKANNSMIFLRNELTEEKFKEYWKTVEASKSGEPGLILTNDLDWGFNPCVEASLRPFSFCNLCETNATIAKTQAELNKIVEVAAFIGTLQASFTDFYYLRPIWRETTEKDALLGISLTGISSMLPNLDLEEAAKVVVDTNKKIAKELGIKSSKRLCCVKPAGSTSLVMGTSSGIHAWHSLYYIRRMRLIKGEPLHRYLKKNIPELIEQDSYNENEVVLSLPIRSPDHAILRTESAIDFLERVNKVHSTWIKGGHIEGENQHNVSATVSIRDNEWEEVGSWLYNNRECYAGMSVIPYDLGSYIQTPFEEIDQEKYSEMIKLVKDIDLSQVSEKDDETNLVESVACAGGQCLL